MIQQELDRLLNDARKNAELKSRLIGTKKAEDPVDEFCRLCQSLGYDVQTIPTSNFSLLSNGANKKAQATRCDR